MFGKSKVNVPLGVFVIVSTSGSKSRLSDDTTLLGSSYSIMTVTLLVNAFCHIVGVTVQVEVPTAPVSKSHCIWVSTPGPEGFVISPQLPGTTA